MHGSPGKRSWRAGWAVKASLANTHWAEQKRNKGAEERLAAKGWRLAAPSFSLKKTGSEL